MDKEFKVDIHDKILNKLKSSAIENLVRINFSLSSCMLYKNQVMFCISNNEKNYDFYNELQGVTQSYHSEINCIRFFLKRYNLKKLPGNLEDYTLITIRVNNKGDLMCSKPCNDCLKVIKRFIKNIIYVNENNELVNIKVKNFNEEYTHKYKQYIALKK